MSTLEAALEKERVYEILHPKPPSSRRSYGRYLAWLALIPAVVYLATFPLLMNPRLPHLGFSKFGPVLDYSFVVTNLNADVVVFGDSSAFLGIDPRIVNAETGLRSVVLPNTVGSLPATGDMPLQRYLQHNSRPRLLVLYFSPWNLDYNDPKWLGLNFEGEEELYRNGSLKDTARFAVHHPFEFLVAPFRALITFGIQNAISFFRHGDRLGQTAAAFGHMDYTFPYPPISKPCEVSAPLLQRVNDDSVSQLARKYQQMQIPVVIYLAPIPDCTGADAVAHRSYAHVQPASPAVEPASWFANDTYFAHVRPERVPESSYLFAQALRSWFGQGTTAKQAEAARLSTESIRSSK